MAVVVMVEQEQDKDCRGGILAFGADGGRYLEGGGWYSLRDLVHSLFHSHGGDYAELGTYGEACVSFLIPFFFL